MIVTFVRLTAHFTYLDVTQEMLRDTLADPQSLCLKEVRLFVPCTLLEGNIELVSDHEQGFSESHSYAFLTS